ncbi:MAG: MFS transporter, partial [Thioalkalispiraceae bacterium]
MRNIILSISSLLFGNSLFLMGIGLLGTLLGIRAGLEGFSSTITGIIMSSYFFGYVLGTYICPGVIQRVGHIRAFATFASIASIAAILYVMFVNPAAWVVFRILTGISIV